MKVLFVSQCSKNAITETRRIIDQFAERKGENVWETNITEQGLQTVKKLLKSTARKNTAVACHLLKGRQQSELNWIVGNARKFNSEGNVPTNITSRNILRSRDENDWNTGESIAILARIAGLFHDFGKADVLFQLKLKGQRKIGFEPFRHEWISLLLFKQFIGESSDREWLEKLSNISQGDEGLFLKDFPRDFDLLKKNPLKGLPKIAKFIGWLILSHHRLPISRKDRVDEEGRPKKIETWMDEERFSAFWNSPNCDDQRCKQDLMHVGSFPEGLPIRSKKWCGSANRAANRALKHLSLLDRDWFKDRFTMHIARLALMLSDHHYSAGKVHEEYQDINYKSYANTEKIEEKRYLKQKLDEHNIGVALNAFLISKNLPKLREDLPSISRHKGFKKRCKDIKFSWQDKAYDLAYDLKDLSNDQGFFGINLASTGCGKTIANARIMYGLSNETKGCRFSVALGLRVLTLQTGDAIRDKLSLKNDDLAVMIGSKAFQNLYELKCDSTVENKDSCGSESLEDMSDELDYVSYEGSLDDGRLSKWLRTHSNLHKMVSAPILVSTIDYLISATEGCRGGKQIAPILRLLTSDLVLDEPDDFDVSDLPALCRLVNFAGVFGSKVLLSSATLPPSIVSALFDAYASGRKSFNQACRKAGTSSEICCAWFDEFGVVSSDHERGDSYLNAHQEFVEKRIEHLEQQTTLRRATLVPLKMETNNKKAKQIIANAIHQSIYQLHDNHHQIHPSGKKVSIGLVRMANINSMVSVVKELLSSELKSTYCVHFCVYHSRFPLLIRSKIEEALDNVLTRHDSERIWAIPEIQNALSKDEVLNHIFVVFATSVAEVGRDHDYDWAVVEPSSMRSIIQLAGRVQRHRRISPSTPNLMILQKNIKGLNELEEVVYCRPGFESKQFRLANKDLSISLLPSQYETITAIPRLRAPDPLNHRGNLSDLEHARLKAALFGGGKSNEIYASMWWEYNPDWCGEIQKQSPFRNSEGKEKEFIYYLEDDREVPKLCEWLEGGKRQEVEKTYFENIRFKPAHGFYSWIDCDVYSEIERLSELLKLNLSDISLKFARIKLRELDYGEKWFNDPILGFYQE